MSTSSFGVTPPVGLAGLLMMISRVLAVILLRIASAEKANPSYSASLNGTGLAPEYLITDS